MIKHRESGDAGGAADGLGRVRDAATETLYNAPGNPTSWALLAEAALLALDSSRRLTPQIPAQAMTRLGWLAMLMNDPHARDLVLSLVDPDQVDADFRVLVIRRDFGKLRRLLWDALVADGMVLQPYPEGLEG